MPRRVDGEGLKRNVEGYAQYFGGTVAVDLARGLLYKGRMFRPEMPLTKEEFLSLNPKMIGDFGTDVRNYITFKADGVIVYLCDVFIDVSLQNTIVKTPLTGLKGTVKEYVCGEDYKVTISGSLISDRQDAYPIKELRKFIELLEKEKPIKVASVYLDAFKIDTLVLESYKIPQSGSKFMNQQSFSLNFISDMDVKLEIS